MGGYAVQLAKAAGAHVIATASPRTSAKVRAQGADEVIDHTAGDVAAALSEPVDVLVNLAPISPEQFTALAAQVNDGGVIVNTTVWMPAPSDEARGVRGIDLFVRSDATQLAELAARVDRGDSPSTSPTAPDDRPRNRPRPRRKRHPRRQGHHPADQLLARNR